MKGEMVVLGKEGDTKIIWDSENADEVKNARKTFNELVNEKGFAAFSVKKNGDTDKKLTTFDADIEKLIFVPRIAGG